MRGGPIRALIAAVTMLALTGPAWAQREQLVIGMTQFPSTFQPSIDAMLAKTYLLGFTQRPFTAYDERWELRCFLCTELPTFENGRARIEELPAEVAGRPDRYTCPTVPAERQKQGVAVTFAIQPKATWGDGVPVTTEDVLFTWEVGRHPQSGVTNAELHRRIWKIDAIDDKTFTIHYDRVDFGYNAINDFELVPAHLERQAFAEPAEYRKRTTFDADPTNAGLWFGPYRVAAVEPGAQIVLEANPTWWGEPPHFRRILLRAIENTAALEANLLSGAVDYIAGELGLSIDQAIAFEQRHGDSYDMLYKPVLFYEHLEPNLDNAALADRRVRQALLYGLDREGMVRQLFAGKQQVALSAVSPLDWVHTDQVRQYPFDPARAAALLDEAGWTVGDGGLRRNAAGEPLAFDLMTTAGDRVRELVEQVLQSAWRRLGIGIRIRNEPARVFFGQTVSQRRFTGLAMFAWLSSPENVPRTTLHSSMIPTAENGWSGQNYAGYRNAEMDGLLDCMDVELDRDRREAMWHRLQALYAEELPALPLYFRSQAFIFPKWLKGIRPTGHQDLSSLWAEEWRAEE